MDFKKTYNKDYFNGKNSFFWKMGYGRFSKLYFDNLFEPLKPYIKKTKEGKVLDVGCAYGFLLERFPDTFEKFGLDISEYATKEAQRRLPAATLKVSSAESELPFPQNFFDIIIFNDVIEHLENPGVALENIRKVLKTEGILYINTPNLNLLRRKVLAYADKKEHHISLFSHRALLSLLAETGFKVVDHWTYANAIGFFFIKFHSNLGVEQAFICKKT